MLIFGVENNSYGHRLPEKKQSITKTDKQCAINFF